EAGLGEPVRADCVSEAADRTAVLDRGTGETLLELDRAIAAAVAPPGAIFEHPRGRYLVLGAESDGAIECEQLIEPHRTTPERTLSVEMPSPRFERRELGGAPIGVASGDARVEEAVVGVR